MIQISLTTREMEEGDLDAVAAIEAQTNPRPWPRSLFAGELDLPVSSRHWLVAQSTGAVAGTSTEQIDADRVLGFGGMMYAPDAAHLMLVAVDPAFGRHGIGGRLCTDLFDEAWARRAEAITLEVRASNQPAIALYEKLAMTAEGRRPGYYPDGEDALIFWLRRDAEGSRR